MFTLTIGTCSPSYNKIPSLKELFTHATYIKVLCKPEPHTSTKNIYSEQQKNTRNIPANIDSQEKITHSLNRKTHERIPKADSYTALQRNLKLLRACSFSPPQIYRR